MLCTHIRMYIYFYFTYSFYIYLLSWVYNGLDFIVGLCFFACHHTNTTKSQYSTTNTPYEHILLFASICMSCPLKPLYKRLLVLWCICVKRSQLLLLQSGHINWFLNSTLAIEALTNAKTNKQAERQINKATKINMYHVVGIFLLF